MRGKKYKEISFQRKWKFMITSNCLVWLKAKKDTIIWKKGKKDIEDTETEDTYNPPSSLVYTDELCNIISWCTVI